MTNLVTSALQVAELALDFGRVNRATLHQDGVTPESDATHTVMLAILACSLTAKHPELSLNVGLIAQLALVHDLVEARCGDTNSFAMTDEARAEKERRETEALASIIAGFSATHPWLVETLLMYEREGCPEARFVRYLDKVTPKLTYTLNRGAYFRRAGITLAEVEDSHNRQIAKLGSKYPEFAGVVGRLLADACGAAEAAFESAP